MSLVLETHANAALANAKLRAVPQHGRPNAFLVIKRAIGGIKILQIDKAVADFQQAVMAGNLRIIERNIGAFSTDDNTWFRKPENFAVGRPRSYGENKHASCWQL